MFHQRLDSLLFVARKDHFFFLAVSLFLLTALSIYAASGGSISGTVADPSGAVTAGAALKLANSAQQTVWQSVTDKQGLYSFPSLPVGRYDLTIMTVGFTTQKKTGISVDTDAAIRLDVALTVGGQLDLEGPAFNRENVLKCQMAFLCMYSFIKCYCQKQSPRGECRSIGRKSFMILSLML